MGNDGICFHCCLKTGRRGGCRECGPEAPGLPVKGHPLFLRPGTVLNGQYLVGRVLGAGGFGITYIGLDTRLEHRVAIKEYMPRSDAVRGTDRNTVEPVTGADEEGFRFGLRRFLDEARILARISQFENPRIVTVLNFFEANGTAYLVMRYLEGRPLSKLLHDRGGRLAEHEAIYITTAMLDGLREVHDNDLVHRDIKPQNVFITSDGGVKLIDFGAARHAASTKSKSVAGVLTPPYAPHEQYYENGRQGPWTDLYAVGATLYQMLTGTLPPEAPARVEDDPLVPPADVAGIEVSNAVSRAVVRAMARRAVDRFQCVTEFQAALAASGGEREADKHSDEEANCGNGDRTHFDAVDDEDESDPVSEDPDADDGLDVERTADEVPAWLRPRDVPSWPTNEVGSVAMSYLLPVREGWHGPEEAETPAGAEHVYRGAHPCELLSVETLTSQEASTSDLAAWFDASFAFTRAPHPALVPFQPLELDRRTLPEEVRRRLGVDAGLLYEGLGVHGSEPGLARFYVMLARRGDRAWKVILSVLSACPPGSPVETVDSNDHVRAAATFGWMRLPDGSPDHDNRSESRQGLSADDVKVTRTPRWPLLVPAALVAVAVVAWIAWSWRADAAREKDRAAYEAAAAEGTPAAAQRYLGSCTVCDYRPQARNDLDRWETRDRIAFTLAVGDGSSSALDRYLAQCVTCTGDSAARAALSKRREAEAKDRIRERLASAGVDPGHPALVSGAVFEENGLVWADTTGNDGSKRIQDAVDKVREGGLVVVRPGEYTDGFDVRKPIHLIGGSRDRSATRLKVRDDDCVEWTARGGSLQRMSLDQVGGKSLGGFYCVDVNGGSPLVAGNDIRSSGGHAVIAIRGASATPTVTQNSIHDGKSTGVFVYDGAAGTIEDNDIFANTLSGVSIKKAANPTVARNRIRDCRGSGVFVYEGGNGTIQDNDIFANTLAGVEIMEQSDPKVRRNRIHDGKQGGVFVNTDGKGTIEDNEIYANAYSGIAVKTGGAPVVRNNRIRDNEHNAVRVYEKGRGTFEKNFLGGNKRGAWDISSDSVVVRRDNQE